MDGHYDLSFVALSIAIAAIASYTALDVSGRVSAGGSSRFTSWAWLTVGAISMGIGIWAMHFIGMLAFHLPIPVAFAPTITLLSLIVAIVVSAIALFILRRPELGTRSLTIGAIVMGLGISAMHYTGMFAMRMSPPIRYDPLLFAVSVMIAIAASFAALWLAFQLRAKRSRLAIVSRLASAAVMGVAIAGMHYTGMAAARFAPDSICFATAAGDINSASLAIIIGGVAAAIMSLTLIISAVEAHFAVEAANPRNHAKFITRGIGGVSAALIITLWVAAAMSVYDAREAAMEHARSETRNLSAAFADEVSHVLDGVTSSMEIVAQRMRANPGHYDIYAWASEIPILSGATIQGGIIGPDGWLIGTTLDPAPAPLDLSDREHVRVHMAGQVTGLFISKPVLGRVSKQITINVTRRVDDKNGKFLGIIIFSLSPAQLTSVHKTIDLGPRGVITLSGLDDNVIRARFSRDSPDGLAGVGQSLAGGGRPTMAGAPDRGTFTRVGVVDKVERLYAYSRVPHYPLVATVGFDLVAVLAASRTDALTDYGFSGAATLLLIGLAGYLIREIRIRATREADLAATNLELIDSTQRAEAANEAKSLFLANMSHELRTPLNAIIGFSQIIRDQTFGAEAMTQYRIYAGDICTSGERLLRLIVDILDMAKVESGKLELEDDIAIPLDLVDGCLSELRLAIEGKQLEVRVEPVAGLPLIRVDAHRLVQVLTNLLTNAVKFTPKGGQVAVVIGCVSGKGVYFEIKDNGIGMSGEEIAIALKPFSQVDNSLIKSYEGTGLGLPLAKRLIELHGGRMTIESAPGRGTTVRVTMPPERVVPCPLDSFASSEQSRARPTAPASATEEV
jgi:NO-binding membrane sensor protein with MHYT domain/signal transduction histidine kinase